MRSRHVTRFIQWGRKFLLKPNVALLVLFLTIYVFTSGGHFYVIDQVYEYVTVQAIVEHGNLNIAFALPLLESLGAPRGYIPGSQGNASTYYSLAGLLQPILSVPFYYLGVLLHVPPWRTISLLYTPMISAISVSLLYSIARRMGGSTKNSLALSLMYGLGSIVWPYSKSYFDVATATTSLLAAAYFLLGNDSDLKSGFASGFFATLSVFARVTQVIMLPGFIVYLLLHHSETASVRYRRLLAFMIPVITGAVSFAYMNWVMFGSPLRFAYAAEANPLNSAYYPTNPLIGIYGLLFSAGYGLFVFYPLCAIGFAALVTIDSDRSRRFAFAWFFLANLFFYARWATWSAGGVFGPRYLVVSVPFLILGLQPYVRSVGTSLSRSAILWVGAAWGFIINLLGVLVNIEYGMWYLFRAGPVDTLWDPNLSPLRGAWVVLWSPVYTAGSDPMFYLIDRFDLFFYVRYGFPALFIFLLVGLAESFWLFKAIGYGKSNVRREKTNRNRIQDVKGRRNKR